MNHHFCSHLVHAYSEQRYYTSDLSELYITSHRKKTPTLLAADTLLWCCRYWLTTTW